MAHDCESLQCQNETLGWLCYHIIGTSDPVGVWRLQTLENGHQPPFAMTTQGMCRFRRAKCGAIPGTCFYNEDFETFTVDNFLPPSGEPNCEVR